MPRCGNGRWTDDQWRCIRDHDHAGNFSIFESPIWPAVGPIPGSPKNDNQYRYQDHQQVVKVEFKRHPTPLKENGLIDQSHSLFIGKILNHEARQEHYEIGNRVQ
jgi:hypothetical protein